MWSGSSGQPEIPLLMVSCSNVELILGYLEAVWVLHTHAHTYTHIHMQS